LCLTACSDFTYLAILGLLLFEMSRSTGKSHSASALNSRLSPLAFLHLHCPHRDASRELLSQTIYFRPKDLLQLQPPAIVAGSSAVPERTFILIPLILFYYVLQITTQGNNS
jgi:hypothetical protein